MALVFFKCSHFFLTELYCFETQYSQVVPEVPLNPNLSDTCALFFPAHYDEECRLVCTECWIV